MSVDTAIPESVPITAAPAATAAVRPSWRRFSLRTLLLLSLLLGSAGSLWAKWSPWQLEKVVIFKLPNWDPQFDYASGSGVLSIDRRSLNSTWFDTPTRTPHKLDYPQPPLWPVFLKDGKRFITAHLDNAVILRDTRDAREIKMIQPAGDKQVLDVLCADKGLRLFVLLQGEMIVYDANTYAELQRHEMPTEPGDHCLVLTKDETLLLDYHKSAIDVFDAATLQPVSKISAQTFVNDANYTFVSPSHGLCVAAYDRDTEAYGVYTLKTGKLAFSMPSAEDNLQVSFDGTRLLLYQATTFKLLDADTGRELLEVPRSNYRWGARLTPDGRQLFVVSQEWLGTQIWDAQTGEQLTWMSATIDVHRFSPDGRSCESIDYERWHNEARLKTWRRIRAESRWGALELPEFWLTVFFAAAVLLSLARDWRAARTVVPCTPCR